LAFVVPGRPPIASGQVSLYKEQYDIMPMCAAFMPVIMLVRVGVDTGQA